MKAAVVGTMGFTSLPIGTLSSRIESRRHRVIPAKSTCTLVSEISLHGLVIGNFHNMLAQLIFLVSGFQTCGPHPLLCMHLYCHQINAFYATVIHAPLLHVKNNSHVCDYTWIQPLPPPLTLSNHYNCPYLFRSRTKTQGKLFDEQDDVKEWPCNT